MKIACLVLFSLISVYHFAQSDAYLVEIGIYKNGKRNKVGRKVIEKLNSTAKEFTYSNSEKAEKYGRLGYELSKEIEYDEGQVTALLNIGGALVYSNRTDSALIFTNIALSIAERIRNDKLRISCLLTRGSIYTHMGDYDKSIDDYFKGIKIAEKVDKKLTTKFYGNIGHAFKEIGNLKKSRYYSEKAYNLSKKFSDTSAMITALNLLGIIENSEKNSDKALKYYEEGLKYAVESNSLERQSHILYNMSGIYFDRKEYDKGFELFNQSMEISKVNGSFLQNAIGFHSLAISYYQIGKLSESAKAADSALSYALRSGNYEMIMQAYAMMAEVSKKSNQLEKGFKYLELAYEYKDSLNRSELNNVALNAEDDYEKEKKHFADSLQKIQADQKAANEQKVTDQKMQMREYLLWFSAFVLILISASLYSVFKKNRLIKAKNTIVESQKAEIQIQHKEITDSINYAQRIQEAIISNETEWKKISDDYFILFKPKDVVSGDFYWAHHDAKNNLSIWAVADCTGHGIPGAFMSMLGIGFLNEIIIENKITNPGEILNQLRNKIISALNKDGKSLAKDGMDISICVWDKRNNNLAYAGANNPLWIIRNRKIDSPESVNRTVEDLNDDYFLHELAPDKMPIGFQLAHPPPFTTKKITVQPNDLIVLLTDGYADQFGGDQGKKLMYKPLKKLLCDLKSNEISNQEEFMNQAFKKWKGDYQQIDDVCLVGVSVSS